MKVNKGEKRMITVKKGLLFGFLLALSPLSQAVEFNELIKQIRITHNHYGPKAPFLLRLPVRLMELVAYWKSWNYRTDFRTLMQGISTENSNDIKNGAMGILKTTAKLAAIHLAAESTLTLAGAVWSL